MTSVRKKNKSIPTALILMYHHVNHLRSDTWQLAVSRENFSEQLEVLKEWDILSMKELVRAIQAKSIPTRSVVLTFDDGYMDNYVSAAPLLESYNYPASFFLTNLIGNTANEFWWDALEYILLIHQPLPSKIELSLRHQHYQWDLTGAWQKILSERQLIGLRSWLPWSTPPTIHHALFIYLCEWLKQLSFADQELIIEQLYNQCNCKVQKREEFKLMTAAETTKLNRNILFEIGGHSEHHSALANFTHSDQFEAIQKNKIYLESLLGRAITGFAYPHGSYAENTIEILKVLDFEYACSTIEAPVTTQTNPFAFPRYQIKNWNGSEFKKQLIRWAEG